LTSTSNCPVDTEITGLLTYYLSEHLPDTVAEGIKDPKEMDVSPRFKAAIESRYLGADHELGYIYLQFWEPGLAEHSSSPSDYLPGVYQLPSSPRASGCKLSVRVVSTLAYLVIDMNPALEDYFARSLGFALLALGLVVVVLTGAVPLASVADGRLLPYRTKHLRHH